MKIQAGPIEMSPKFARDVFLLKQVQVGYGNVTIGTSWDFMRSRPWNKGQPNG